MLKISYKLKKSYWGNTRGRCRHSYLYTKAKCCGNFLVSPRTQPQRTDKEGRRQGWAALHMILHLADPAGHVEKKGVAFEHVPEVTDLTLEPSQPLLRNKLLKLLAGSQIPAVSCWPSSPPAAQLNHQLAKMWSLNPVAQPQPRPAGLRVSVKLMEGLILSNLQGQPPKKWEPHFWTSPLPARFHMGFKITKTNNLNQNSWKPFSPFPSSGLHVSPMADSGLLWWYLTPLASAAPSTLV